MNLERRKLGTIYTELDAAFATVQVARSRHELGCEDAQKVARQCVVTTVASINRRLLEAALTPAESQLIQAKLRALIGAAARIPGPGTAVSEPQPRAKAAALLGS